MKTWLHSLLAAVIGGIANSVCAMFVAPETFNLQDLPKLGKLIAASGIISVFLFLKQSPLPKNESIPIHDPHDDIPMRAWIIGLGLSALLLAGCSHGVVRGSSKTTVTDPNGVVTATERRIRASDTEFFDSSHSAEKLRITNTEKTLSLGEQNVGGSASSTNLPAVLNSAGGLIGEAARAFLGVPALGPPK